MVGGSYIHDAIYDQGREFRAPAETARRGVAPERIRPNFPEPVNVITVDLSQRRVARPGKVPVISRPVGGLGCGIRGSRRTPGGWNGREQHECNHGREASRQASRRSDGLGRQHRANANRSAGSKGIEVG